jgi:acetyltransferase-like isoleucine patch superfamily enzyme
MKNELRVPFLNANEDEVKIIEIFVKNGEKVLANSCICIFESTKTTFEFLLEDQGESFVYLFQNIESLVKVGSVFGISSDIEISNSELNELAKEHIVETKNDRIIISNKAKEYLKLNNINPTDIKESGTITLEDVKNFHEKNNKSNNEIIDEKVYKKLEFIFKDDKIEEDYDFILKLKHTLNWVDKIYSQKWDRKIPIFDVLFDRWQNAKNLNFGKNSNISQLSFVFGKVKVGMSTFIGPYTIIDGSGGIEIGNNCSIAAGVKIYSHDTVARSLSGGILPIKKSPTIIGDNCFIGPNTVITRGIKISNRVYVGANCVIINNVPENSVVMGNPAKIVGKVIFENGEIKIEINK